MGDTVILNLSTGREYCPGNVHFDVYVLLRLESEMHGNVVLLIYGDMVIKVTTSVMFSATW